MNHQPFQQTQMIHLRNFLICNIAQYSLNSRTVIEEFNNPYMDTTYLKIIDNPSRTRTLEQFFVQNIQRYHVPFSLIIYRTFVRVLNTSSFIQTYINQCLPPFNVHYNLLIHSMYQIPDTQVTDICLATSEMNNQNRRSVLSNLELDTMNTISSLICTTILKV